MTSGRISHGQADDRLTRYAPQAVGIAGTAIMLGATFVPEAIAFGHGALARALGHPDKVQQVAETVADVLRLFLPRGDAKKSTNRRNLQLDWKAR